METVFPRSVFFRNAVFNFTELFAKADFLRAYDVSEELGESRFGPVCVDGHDSVSVFRFIREEDFSCSGSFHVMGLLVYGVKVLVSIVNIGKFAYDFMFLFSIRVWCFGRTRGCIFYVYFYVFLQKNVDL